MITRDKCIDIDIWFHFDSMHRVRGIHLRAIQYQFGKHIVSAYKQAIGNPKNDTFWLLFKVSLATRRFVCLISL